MTYHIISYYIILCNIKLYHIILCCVALRRVKSFFILLYCNLGCITMLKSQVSVIFDLMGQKNIKSS